MSEERFSYQLTKTEWVRALFCAARRNRMLRLALGFSTVWLAMWCLMVAISTTQMVLRHDHDSFIPLVVAFIFGPLYFAMIAFQIRREVSILPFQGSNHSITLSIDDEAIVASVASVCDVRFSWQAVEGYAQNRMFGVIFFTKRAFVAYPKRAIPDHVQNLITSKMLEVRGRTTC